MVFEPLQLDEFQLPVAEDFELILKRNQLLFAQSPTAGK